MKSSIKIMVFCGLLLMAAGCKKSKDKEPETFLSNQSKPTWAVSADYDMTTSMTAVIQIDLKAQYPEKASDWQLTDQDLLAAFDDAGNCLGVAEQVEGLFFLYIAQPSNFNSQIVNSQIVNLRYYSSHYKNIFEQKNAFTFQTDGIQGSVSKPYIPTLVLSL